MRKVFIVSFLLLIYVIARSQNIDINIQSQYIALRDSMRYSVSETKDMDFSERDFVSETYQIPGYALYDQYWDTENINSRKLSIPFGGNPLRIILVQSNNNPFFFPCMGDVKTKFGPVKGVFHPGIDLVLKANSPVKSCFDGVVRMAKIYGDYGRVVVVRHYNGLETVYANLSQIMVKPGQILRAGDVVGASGKSEKTMEEILHFEVRFMNECFNPALFIDFAEMDLLDNTLVLNETDLMGENDNQKESIVSDVAKSATGQGPESADVQYHVVKAGETMYRISIQYNIPLNSLLQMNNMTENNATICVGQKIRIR
ncbi:MAG: peptidoglycan DD-metalloendopeptidase family protein [Bacteroidales bacterium]|nr:peptidoglycan DD-metalloendopeptidase family protein [Bacteroidales bacterium]